MDLKINEIIKETKDYKITSITFEGLDYTDNMESLELKINGIWTFIQNYSIHGGSEALEMAESFIKTKNQGFFKVHGQGKPLDQFKDNYNYEFEGGHKLLIADFSKLRDFTHLSKKNPSCWEFWGNHETVSAVFRFLIWNPELVNQIDNTLTKSYNYQHCLRCDTVTHDLKKHNEIHKEEDLEKLIKKQSIKN